jgi:uncharacterized protein YjbI with pentapeptide repeats
MDRGQFDALARLVWTRQSRRAALAMLLGAAVLGRVPAPLLAKKTKKRKATAAAADACYPNTACIPGKGRNASGCDFSFSSLLQNKDVRGSNLSNSNFIGANLTGADFRGANLSGGCFVGADLTGARLGGSVNLGGAIFCQTTMPDGTRDNSGCERETACCRTRLQDEDCPDATIYCARTQYPHGEGLCTEVVGDVGTVGRCYSVLNGCCPCEHPDEAYWDNLCNQTFPACDGDLCVAEDQGWLPCYEPCPVR